MKINIIQTITNILDENRALINSNTIESYILHPDQGKALQNIKTGKVYTSSINIGSKGQAKDYIEIDL